MDSKKWIVRYIELALDVVVMFIAYAVANKIKFGGFRTGILYPEGRYLTLFLIEMAAYGIISLLFFVNDNLLQRNAMQEILALIKLYAYTVALTALFIYFTKSAEYYSREQMIWFFIISFVLVFGVRQWLKRIITKSYHRSGANEKIMLVTTSDQAERVVKRIKETRNWYFRISGIAILDQNRIGDVVNKIDVVADAANLLEMISTSEIDSVFLHIPDDFPFAYKKFISDVRSMGKTIHMNIDEYELHSGAKQLQFLGKYAVVSWTGKYYRLRELVIKRLMDVVAGLLGSVLMIVFWPLLALCHLVEGDRGHTLLQVVRVGKNGRRFYMYKFRVMYQDAEERYLVWKMEGAHGTDPRYSRTGKLIKALGIELLPNAWNMLWGDMSVVGAIAPSLPDFIGYSREQRKGLRLKPGVTGFYRAFYKERGIEALQQECDDYYIEEYSTRLDLQILGRAFLNKFTTKRSMRDHAADFYDEMNFLADIRADEAPLVYEDGYFEEELRTKKTPPFYAVLKRTFDIVSSLLALIVLSPVFLLLAVLVRWEDGGSVFYGHTRVGYHGKKITVYKFRSMKMRVGDLEKILTPEQLEQYKKEFKIDNDPRITKIGNILRKTSLDELPQLFNILKGDLSVIGPRPIVAKETAIYGRRVAKLLSVKPGLTGYWQAYARNNATYESGERQKMEMYYVDNRSLWLDIKILFRTVVSVIKRDGAE